MRGKLPTSDCKSVDNRITPADAGKTFACCPVARCNEDHPRGCGENRGFTVAAVVNLGSPPRMRGKPTDARPDFQRMRITPAGAGKTKVTSYQSTKSRDHPRRCGENFLHAYYTTSDAGSPPQVRGKQSLAPAAFLWARITPAGAGKTPERFNRSGCS